MPVKPDDNVDPLDIGQGATELEIFLEPTCPFSKRAFEKLRPLLDSVGEDRLTIRIRFVSQPWHLFSGIVTRGILAASATEGGRTAALEVMNGIYQRREEFEFEHHHSGANMDRTPRQILADISALAGTDLSDAWKLKSVDRALRWHTKYSRQNGVHESPTFSVNRIINPSMSSGQTIEEWRKHLDL